MKWDATKGVLWKSSLPGKGFSTPVVWQERIYLTVPVDGHDAVLAFDWAGKELWRTVLGLERPGKNVAGSGCNPSPVTDGKSIFVYFKSGDVAALDLSGKVRWRTNLQERFGKDSLYWDVGTSPVLTERDVMVAVLQPKNAYLVALDRETGEMHWKVTREYKTAVEGDHGYATPLVLQQGGREALLVWGAEHLTAQDAANGAVLWSCGDFNPEGRSNWPACASPVVAGDTAVIAYARGMRLHGIKLDGTGDVTASHRIWKRENMGAFVTTPAVYKGLVYVQQDVGKVASESKLECVDPATGKAIWSGAIPSGGAKFYASPVVAGGNLYVLRNDGLATVIRTETGSDGAMKVLSVNATVAPATKEQFNASPVPVGGRLLIRGDRNLYCIGASASIR